MRVIATALGFDGRDLRAEGDEFEMPDGAKGSWFKPVDEAKPVAPAGAKPAKASARGDDLT